MSAGLEIHPFTRSSAIGNRHPDLPTKKVSKAVKKAKSDAVVRTHFKQISFLFLLI